VVGSKQHFDFVIATDRQQQQQQQHIQNAKLKKKKKKKKTPTQQRSIYSLAKMIQCTKEEETQRKKKIKKNGKIKHRSA
jgi:hypothetical protein